MSQSKVTAFALPLMIFTLLFFVFLWALDKDPSVLPSELINKPLPEFAVTGLKQPDKTLTQKELTGKIRLLNVWGTWCPSCYVEHPFLVELAQKNAIDIVGLNYKDKRDAALKYLEKGGDPYEFILYDDRGRLGIDLGVYGAPETFLIDENGLIRYRHVGVVDERVWKDVLLPMIQKIKQGF